MKVTVNILVEFEPNDNEECGEFRKSETAFRGNWDALPDAIGQAIEMIGPPRPQYVVAKLVDELGIEESETYSGQMAKAAGAVIEAFKRLDDKVRENLPVQEILDEMVII